MLYIVDSSRPLAEIQKDFPEVAARHRFGVLAVHDLRHKMKEKGVAFGRPCLVFEICNPEQAKKALEENMGLSTVLPCRVSAYREGGQTKLATAKPTELLAAFGSSGRQIAQEVERAIIEIMEELAAAPSGRPRQSAARRRRHGQRNATKARA